MPGNFQGFQSIHSISIMVAGKLVQWQQLKLSLTLGQSCLLERQVQAQVSHHLQVYK